MTPHLLSMPQILQIFMSSFAVLMGLRLVAPRFGLVDRPGGRKRHVGQVPVVGGIGVFVGATIGLWSTNSLTPETSLLLFFLGVIVVVGTIDDRFDLKASLKLLAQVIACTLLVGFFPRQILVDASLPLPTVALDALAVLFLVGSMNALNMLDGVDGLAGGVSSITLSILTVSLFLSGAFDMLPIATSILASVMAFLALNARSPWLTRATIFLGDAGSMLLGLVIAFLCLSLTTSSAKWSFANCAFFIAFPAFETISVAIRRIYAGRSPFSADRTHLHHLLQDHGWTPSAISLVLSLATGGLGLLGVLLHLANASLFQSSIALLVCFAGHSAFVIFLTRPHPSYRMAKNTQE